MLWMSLIRSDRRQENKVNSSLALLLAAAGLLVACGGDPSRTSEASMTSETPAPQAAPDSPPLNRPADRPLEGDPIPAGGDDENGERSGPEDSTGTEASTDGDQPAPETPSPSSDPCPASLSAAQCADALDAIANAKPPSVSSPKRCPPGLTRGDCRELREAIAGGEPPPRNEQEQVCPEELSAAQCEELGATAGRG
jgi:hypothetical protein